MIPVFRLLLFALFLTISFTAQAQLATFPGKPEAYIYESLSDCELLEEQSLEHQEFDILVCSARDHEISVFYRFYKGDKVCSTVRAIGRKSAFTRELDYIFANFRKKENGSYEDPNGLVTVSISEKDGEIQLFIGSGNL